MCFLHLWVLNYTAECHENFGGFLMHICSIILYKVNIKVCKTERKKVQKRRYFAITGTLPMSVDAQN